MRLARYSVKVLSLDNKILVLAAALLGMLGILSMPLIAYGETCPRDITVPPTENQVSGTEIVLESSGDSRLTGSATANVTIDQNGLYDVALTVNVKNLPDSVMQGNDIAEAWLIDDSTGYAHNLGAFEVSEDNNGTMTIKHKMSNFALFDKIIVSIGAKPATEDTTPSPSKIILTGDLSPLKEGMINRNQATTA
ncbi:hypothetical protein C4569_01325 [Candidatus Parcubacteria bacterium]|nr:MAG: hypothetical protein C4569_01325 [Candidatus Parcubacteria bacterium]